jgi:DNA polymerase III epsilon subunit-like protein
LEARFAELEFAELEFAVIDLETTGWSPGVAAITEIAAVRVRGGRRQGEFASLVNPDVPVPQGIEDLTGISDWMLAAAPMAASWSRTTLRSTSASCVPRARSAAWLGRASPCWTRSCWPGS